MTFVITRTCQSTCDTACVGACPVDAIHGPVDVAGLQTLDPAQRATATHSLQLYIDPDECICCGACVPACPVEAIFSEDEVPAELEEDIEANARFYRS